MRWRDLWRRIFGPPREGGWIDVEKERAADEQAMRDSLRDFMQKTIIATNGIAPRYEFVKTPPKFEIYRTRDGRFKWRTRGSDGTVHRVSTVSYGRKRDALRGFRRATQ